MVRPVNPSGRHGAQHSKIVLASEQATWEGKVRLNVGLAQWEFRGIAGFGSPQTKPQVLQDAPRRLIAVLGGFGQKPLDDPSQPGWGQRSNRGGRRDDLVQKLHPVQRGKGRPAFDQKMQDGAQRKEIGPAVGAARQPAGLFGGLKGKLIQGTVGKMPLSSRPPLQAFGEQGDLQAAVHGSEEHGMGRQASVVQTGLVQTVDRFGQTQAKAQDFAGVGPRRIHQGRQRRTQRRLHQQALRPPPVFQPQRAQQPGFGLSAQVAHPGRACLKICIVFGAG